MNKRIGLYTLFAILFGMAFAVAPIPPPIFAQSPVTPTATFGSLQRLRTGATIRQDGNWKWGDDNFLLIENELDQDAVVALTAGSQTVYSVYVRAHEAFRLEAIWKDVFNLTYTAGDDWDIAQARFNRNIQTYAFEDSLKFERNVVGDLIWFTVWKARLSRSSGVDSNAAMSEIGSRPFPRRDPSCHEPTIPIDERLDCDFVP